VKLVVSDLIRGLEDGESDGQIRKRLDDLPNTLEDLYKRVVEKIPSNDLHEALNYFGILLRARQISLLEFAVAADFCRANYVPNNETWSDAERYDHCLRMSRLLQARCRGFIQLTSTIGESNRKAIESIPIDFLHRTAKDYISDTQGQNDVLKRVQQKNLVCDPNVVLMACQLKLLICIRDTLNFRELEKWVLSRIRKCLYFARGAEISTGRAQTTLLNRLEEVCDERLPKWEASYVSRFVVRIGHGYQWWDTMDEINRWSVEPYVEWNPSMISLAVMENLVFCIKEQLEIRRNSLNASSWTSRWMGKLTLKTKYEQRPLLHYAVEYAAGYDGNRDMTPTAELLLQYGESTDKVFQGRTAWQLALEQDVPGKSAHDWANLIILFLDHGADPNEIVRRKLEYKKRGDHDLLLERPALSWFLAWFQGSVSDTVAVVAKFIAVHVDLGIVDSDDASVYQRLFDRAQEIQSYDRF